MQAPSLVPNQARKDGHVRHNLISMSLTHCVTHHPSIFLKLSAPKPASSWLQCTSAGLIACIKLSVVASQVGCAFECAAPQQYRISVTRQALTQWNPVQRIQCHEHLQWQDLQPHSKLLRHSFWPFRLSRLTSQQSCAHLCN
jgi:hypothetical protein